MTAAPPIAPRIGAAWAATFSLTHDSEARGDLRNQTPDDWRGLRGDPLGSDEARAVGDRLGERRPDGEIAALEGGLSAPLSAEREHFDAGESRLRSAEIFPLLARDLGDQAKRMVVETGSSIGSRRQPERASNGPGRRGGELMGAVSRASPTRSDRACAKRA